MTSLPCIHAVTGILWKEGKVLVAKRSLSKPHPDKWEFPGGKIEDKESPQQAVIRELYEEIHIKACASHTRFLLNFVNVYPNDKKVSLDVFLITAWEGEPHPLEHQEISFVSLAQLEQEPLRTAFLPGLDKILPHLKGYY